jgi:hypothetical protein
VHKLDRRVPARKRLQPQSRPSVRLDGNAPEIPLQGEIRDPQSGNIILSENGARRSLDERMP